MTVPEIRERMKNRLKKPEQKSAQFDYTTIAYVENGKLFLSGTVTLQSNNERKLK
jgi:hypothetical protein